MSKKDQSHFEIEKNISDIMFQMFCYWKSIKAENGAFSLIRSYLTMNETGGKSNCFE